MKRQAIFLIVLLILMLSSHIRSANPIRQRLLMDFNWKFLQSDIKDAEKTNFDDKQWVTINLPHDWSIEGEFSQDAPTKGAGGYLPAGIGWYRKHFNLPAYQKDQNL